MMSPADERSLLSFLGAPVVVADPEGRIIYANPAFERSFGECGGGELVSRFAGGGREALLGAVARVSESGDAVRFRLRENGLGYVGLASPIEVERESVGVMLLLTEEPPRDEERLLAIEREIREPLDEIGPCLEQLLEQTGGRRNERFRADLERGLEALDRARKWSDALRAALVGRDVAPTAVFDPARAVRAAARRLEPELADAGAVLELLVPARLPPVFGDAARLETALVHLLRHRLGGAENGGIFTLSARAALRGERVLVSVVDPPDASSGGDAVPRPVREVIEELGARLVCLSDPALGRASLIELEQSPAR